MTDPDSLELGLDEDEPTFCHICGIRVTAGDPAGTVKRVSVHQRYGLGEAVLVHVACYRYA